MAGKCVVLLMFLYTSILHTSSSQDLLFPHGTSEGDTFIPANDDGGSGIILISTLFPFFDSNHDFLYVNTNGVISFLGPVPQFTPDPFPLDGDRRLIAPFWADVDTEKGGENSYRELLRGTPENEDIFKRADDIIHDAFIDQDNFEATWMFVATWNEVGFYGSNATDIVNTFQVVAVTNGRHSFSIHNYGEVMWTTGMASEGDPNTGLGGIPAQAGFNAGDGIRFTTIPGSRTPEIVDIELTTNVDTRGRWVFRIDSAEVDDSGCNTAGTLTVYPIIGSMLGGEQVLIRGPCFNDTADVICKFGETEVAGILVSNTTASCITPTLFVTGRIPFTVSVDGGVTYDFEGIYTMLSVDQTTPGIQRINGNNWHAQNELNITWDTETWSGIIDLCDIYLLIYIEDQSSRHYVGFEDELLLIAGIPYDLGEFIFQRSNFQLPVYFTVGVFKLLPQGENSRSVLPALWSDVHNLKWITNVPSAPWCQEWYWFEQTNLDFVSVTHSCPCTLNQALVDTARFTAHPDCDVSLSDEHDEASCDMRPGAIHCVQANEPTSAGGGQECCYGADEDVLNVLFDDGGGFAHRYHHSGVSPYDYPGKVPYLSHFYADVIYWEHCCFFDGAENCKFYREVRPSQTCENYQPPPPGGGSGDPHLITLDGNSYTFNGLGEYVFVTANNNTFELQARTSVPSAAIDTGYNVTAFTAVAARMGTSDTIHVEVSERRVLDVWVRLYEQITWTRLDFDVATSWSFNGVYVSGRNISGSGVLVVFNHGASMEIKATKDVMSVLFLGSQDFRNDTMGLLGTWNGNPDDDFIHRNGTILSQTSSTEDLHSFGQSWEVDSTSSLFYYPVGRSWEDFRDPLFIPEFDPPDNPNIDNETLWAVCQGNEWCMFDFQVTEDEDIAVASKVAYEETIAVSNASSNVIICGPLETPENGAKTISKSSVGGIAMFTCLPGYSLEGDVEITCMPSGEWSGTPPICTAIPTTPTQAIPTTFFPTTQLPDKFNRTDKILILSGIVVGSLGILIALIVAVVYCVCRSSESKKSTDSNSEDMQFSDYTYFNGYTSKDFSNNYL